MSLIATHTAFFLCCFFDLKLLCFKVILIISCIVRKVNDVFEKT